MSPKTLVFSTTYKTLVAQALLGHASPDTVMIYAKLYPGQLI
jgi:hypothetical protein